MKTFKKIICLALIAVLALSIVACDNGKKGPEKTPKPTPEPIGIKLPDGAIENYYLEYTVTEPMAEEIVDENGQITYGEVTNKTTNVVEVSYSSLILRSTNGGETFEFEASSTPSFAIVSTNDARGAFSAYCSYKVAGNNLENQGKENVAGIECDKYHYKNGLMNITMWVDPETDMCMKYQAEGYQPKTVEITTLKFNVIETPGYEFVNYQSKVGIGDTETEEVAE